MASSDHPLLHLIETGLSGPSRLTAIFPRTKVALTNHELLDLIGKRRCLLKEKSFPTRVILHLGKSPEYLSWLLACFAEGACVCPVDPGHGEAELKRAAAAFKPDWIVAHHPLPFLDPMPNAPVKNETIYRNSPEARSGLPPGTALCMFTSGTTGRAKGVLLSENNLAYGSELVPLAHQIAEQDRALAILPLSMINGMVTTILAILRSRSSAIYYEGMFTAYQAFQWAIEHQATWINAVPVHYAAFCNPFLSTEERTGHRVRFCRSAGSRLPVQVLQDFENHYKIPIIETMGLTETAGQVFANPMELDERKIGSVGRPVGIEAKIVSSAFEELSDGEEGEIWIRGENVFLGYLDDPTSTAQALHDGWLRTGDRARRSVDGFFTLTGRIKEIVIRGGQNVSLQEIDDTLCQHPAIALSGSVGLDADLDGETVVSFVQLKLDRKAGEKELLAHCAERLAAFKLPSQITLLEKLPLRSNGKVDKQELKRMANCFKEKAL